MANATSISENKLLNSDTLNNIQQLDSLSVVGKKYDKAVAYPFSFCVINSSEWIGTNKTLADIISEQTGIQTKKYGGSGSFQTISIRGVEGKEVIVFLDGIPLNSSMGGAVDLSAINPETIEEIEIYKSIIPARLGGNSLGGVINLKSKKSNFKKIKNMINFKGGAYGYKEASMSTTGNIKNIANLFSIINFISSDNNWYYLDRNKTPYNPDDDIIKRIENHKYKAFDIRFNPTISFTDGKEVRSGISYSSSILGIPASEGSINRTAKSERDMAIVTVNFLDTKGLIKDNLYPYIDIGYLWWKDNLFWTSFDENMGSSHGTIIYNPNSFSKSESRFSLFYGNGMIDFNICEYINTQIVINGKYSSIWTETYTNGIPHGDWPGSSFELTSASDISIKIPFGNFAINTYSGISAKISRSHTLGGYNDLLRIELPPKDTIEKVWSLKGGAKLSYKDFCNLFFNASIYSNIPSLRERFGTNGAVLPNPSLKKETENSFEAGIRFIKSRFSGDITGFIVKSKDKIVMIFDGNMTKPANLGASLTKGVETSLLFNPVSFVKAEIRSTIQNPENLSLFNNYYKKKLPNEPILSLIGKLILYPFPNTEIDYWVDYRSFFYRDYGNTQRIPDNSNLNGIDFHNILAKVNLIGNFNIYFSIRNISRFTLRYEELTKSYESGYSWILYPVNEWCLTIETTF